MANTNKPTVTKEASPMNDDSFASQTTPSSNSSFWVNTIERDIKNEGSNNNNNANFKAAQLQMGIANNLNYFNSMNHVMPNLSMEQSFNSLSLSPTTGSIKTPGVNPPNMALQSLLSSTSTPTLPLNPYSTAFSPIFNNNQMNITPASNNGFNFPTSTFPNNAITNNSNSNSNMTNNTSTSPIPISVPEAMLNKMKESQQQAQKVNVKSKAHNVGAQHSRSITVNFLTMYYNSLHTSPVSVKRFYHVKAQINRNIDGKNTNTNEDLSGLENVLFVDIDNIVHQKTIDDAILIRVNGTMKFIQKANKKFDQTFIIKKNPDGFWLVHNDIFILTRNQSKNTKNFVQFSGNGAAEERIVVAKESNQQQHQHQHHLKDTVAVASYSNVTAKSMAQMHCDAQALQQQQQQPMEYNMVNKRMVNKFYHDASYQNYDNDLAIFIRGVPKSMTHSKLCGILSRNLLTHANGSEICIDYIDVNYHKQFAFVYFGNEETLEIALRMGTLYINNQLCQIQRKRSHNGPRKFLPKQQRRC